MTDQPEEAVSRTQILPDVVFQDNLRSMGFVFNGVPFSRVNR